MSILFRSYELVTTDRRTQFSRIIGNTAQNINKNLFNQIIKL